MNWQDVMIEHFGSDWPKGSYSLVEIGKLAEKIASLEEKLRVDEKILNALKDMVEIQGRAGNWNCDEYMHGMYNGMEFMLSIAESREPQYRGKPEKGWLSENPRNYTLELITKES